MKTRTILTLLSILLCSVNVFSQSNANETEAAPIDWPTFELSDVAKAAGIDGKLQIGLTVSAEGRTSNIRIYGGPMWPCGAKEPNEVENVRKSVKNFLQIAKFQPATKNGKPRSSDVQITFLLSELFKNAANSEQIADNLRKDIFPQLVEVKDVHRFAVDTPNQLSAVGNSISYRLSEVQVLVDEEGKVISAGGLRTDPMYLAEARRLACSVKFKPLIFKQRALKMSGSLLFGLY